jgi:hypothetical protein
VIVHIDGRVAVMCDRCFTRFRPEDAPGTQDDVSLALASGWQELLGEGFPRARAIDKDTKTEVVQVAQPGHACPAHAVPVVRTNIEEVTRSPAILVEEDGAFAAREGTAALRKLTALDEEVIDPYVEKPPAEKARGVWALRGYEEDGE